MQTSSIKIGSWENHTKGFGSKIMKNFGWKEGDPIGKNANGLIEPLSCEARSQFDLNDVKVIKKTKSDIDEKKKRLIIELDKLMLDSDDEDEGKIEAKNKTSPVFKSLRPCRLGSVSGPIVWL
jgi:hypothetical protein